MSQLKSTRSAAVVVPVYRREFTTDEEISLRHLRHFLSSYDRWLCLPTSLEVHLPGFGSKHFEDRHFTNVASYSKLLLSKEFYESFAAYEYILIYQLDSLVFSNHLGEWCQASYDYIGAPLFRSETDASKGFSRVGNGGFSLRNVQSFVRVLESERGWLGQVGTWRKVFTPGLKDLQRLSFLQRWVKKIRILRNVSRGVEWFTANYTLNEDLFWSDRAQLFHPGFRIAPADVALGFSFERHPRYCFEQNDRQLPFGCHAWAKWDRSFWESYLLKW